MRRKATTLLALLALLAAGVPAAHAQPGATVTAQAPKRHKCFDGHCTITVRKPVSFAISKRFGYSRLTVSRHGLSVRVSAKGSGTTGVVTIGKGGRGTLNTLSVRIVSISRTKATVRCPDQVISPRPFTAPVATGRVDGRRRGIRPRAAWKAPSSGDARVLVAPPALGTAGAHLTWPYDEKTA